MAFDPLSPIEHHVQLLDGSMLRVYKVLVGLTTPSMVVSYGFFMDSRPKSSMFHAMNCLKLCYSITPFNHDYDELVTSLETDFELEYDVDFNTDDQIYQAYSELAVSPVSQYMKSDMQLKPVKSTINIDALLDVDSVELLYRTFVQTTFDNVLSATFDALVTNLDSASDFGKSINRLDCI